MQYVTHIRCLINSGSFSSFLGPNQHTHTHTHKRVHSHTHRYIKELVKSLWIKGYSLFWSGLDISFCFSKYDYAYLFFRASMLYQKIK